MRDGFPAGLASGAIFSLGICWMIDPKLGPVFEAEAIQFVTIGASLAAAAFAYEGVLRGINHKSKLEAECPSSNDYGQTGVWLSGGNGSSGLSI